MKYNYSLEMYEEMPSGTRTDVGVMEVDAPNQFVGRQIAVRAVLSRGQWVRWIRPEPSMKENDR